jgi:hypothetical protein
VLTSEPDADVTVYISTPKTPTSLVVDEIVQMEIVNTPDGTGTVTFTKDNWNIPQTVTVSAFDDKVVDGGDLKVFAPQLHTVAPVQGPLLIQGAGGFGSLNVIGPLMLPGETNIKPPTGEVADATDLPSGVAPIDRPGRQIRGDHGRRRRSVRGAG